MHKAEMNSTNRKEKINELKLTIRQRKALIEQIKREIDDMVRENALFKPGDQVTASNMEARPAVVRRLHSFSEGYIYEVLYVNNDTLGEPVQIKEENMVAGWNLPIDVKQ